jgi:hypothetical protein
MHTLHKGTAEELYSQHKENLQDHCWRSDASCHDASGRTVGQRLIKRRKFQEVAEKA